MPASTATQPAAIAKANAATPNSTHGSPADEAASKGTEADDSYAALATASNVVDVTGSNVAVTDSIVEVVTGSNVVVTVPTAASMNAYGFPVDEDITATQIGDDLPALSFIYTWDAVGQTYVPVSKNSRGAWSGAANVAPADGFWIINPGAEIDVPVTAPFTP